MESLADTIKDLRNSHQLTQEDLATLCQVSHVAVSKWETGKSMPDITLLPILARIFEVSIDELLNFKKTLSEEEVMVLSKESIESFSIESFPKAMMFTKNLIQTYPNSELLKLRLAGNLMQIIIRVQKEELIEEYRQFALPLLESVTKSQDASFQYSARILMANLLSMGDKTEEALAVLKPIPKLSDPSIMEANYCHLLKRDEEAISLLESFIYTNVQNICLALSSLLNIKQKRNPNEEEFEQFVSLLTSIEKGFRVKVGVLDQLFSHYAKQQNEERTLHYLNVYVDRILQFDSQQEQIRKSMSLTPWFSDIPQSKHTQTYPKGAMKQACYQSLHELPSLAFLKENQTFQEILQRLV